MKRLLLWIAALFILALLVALGASVAAGSPDPTDPTAVAQPDRPQPDALASDLRMLTVTSPISPTPSPTAEPHTKTYLPIVMKRFVGGTTPTIIFSDNFNDGLLHGWTRNKGNWYNENNYMRGQLGAPGTAWNIKNASGTNFIYEGDVNLVSGGPAGLVFRSSADGEASYEAVLLPSGWFGIGKRPGYAVLAKCPWGVSNNHWYHIKVVVTGTKIEGYLDGVKRLTAYDTNYSSGQFGVMTGVGTGAYDNLEARALP